MGDDLEGYMQQWHLVEEALKLDPENADLKSILQDLLQVIQLQRDLNEAKSSSTRENSKSEEAEESEGETSSASDSEGLFGNADKEEQLEDLEVEYFQQYQDELKFKHVAFISSGIQNNFDNHEAFGVQEPSLVRKDLSHGPQSEIANWEKFTRGIGSRLLEQMGYQKVTL
jgi:hypothetical protein